MSDSPHRNPVLLIHGIDDTDVIFKGLSRHLRQLGWEVYTLNLVPSNGDVGLDRLALQVASFVNTTFAAGQPIDLLGFSMGGIISRYYVQRLGGIHRVQRFITVSSPHQGTWTGHLRFNEGAGQMRPGSPFLQDLKRDVMMLDRLQFTSIWTPLDLMIVPANSSQLPVGREVVIPVAGHAWMISDYRVWNEIVTALSIPVNRAQTLPPPPTCKAVGP